MKIVEIIVLICCIRVVQSSRDRYCAICNNHTLCKYAVEGPSSKCTGYNRTGILSEHDIVFLVNRINERRHMVAMGLLNRYPQAANMKKMRWSRKLANFAQRWADQCDPSVRPSKEDECRDLASMKVGQAIATVLGPSPGLNVRSFVDIWFMLNLDYEGSVTYYNQSKDAKANYFTQLIWADTAYVGCGKATFYVEDLNTNIERLVCNFAPKGNIHERPIYTIGYPATQCPKQMIPDVEFSSLCQQTPVPARKFFDKGLASNLLRILNLSNNSLKQDLDPNNLKQINLSSSEMNDQRNQKTRHVYLNNSYGAMKRDSFHLQNPSSSVEGYNDSQYSQRQYTQERGHSRMYHGHRGSKDPMVNFDFTHANTETDYRRSDFTSPTPLYSNSMQDARKHYVDGQCTRKLPGESHNCNSPSTPCKTKECTRGQTTCPHVISPCQHTPFPRIEPAFANKLWPCNEQTTVPVECDCNRKYQPTSKCASFTTTHCPYRRIGNDQQDDSKSSKQFDYYDLFHNLEFRSGDVESSIKQHFNNPSDNIVKPEYIRRESDLHGQVKTIIDRPKTQHFQDSYRSFDYSKRKKRDFEEQTFKPFWQMDEYNQKGPSELKSIRYTTLGNKRHRKTRRTEPTTRLPTSTETITIKIKDKSSVSFNNRGRITEKYLSFDELMHLRKLSTVESLQTDARRKGADALRDANTMDPNKTTTMTANTPFKRQKHCTRKLTCTWTAAMNGSGGAGGAGGGGGGFDVGSKTPPGYVDGCTRTSTCTRDYMDRNKMATSSDESLAGTTLEDEDYCERRSLNVRRRDLDENRITISSIGYQEAYTEFPLLTTKLYDEIVTSQDSSEPIISQTDNIHCICNDDTSRLKRRESSRFYQLLCKDCNGNKDKNLKRFSNNDEFYASANMRSKNRMLSYQCPCNGTKSLQNMFYRVIMLKYCATCMFYYMFMKKTLQGWT